MATTTASPEAEELRGFLNTWLIPNDTRAETETLPQLAADASAWREAFARTPVPRRDELAELTRLRDDLRADVEEGGTRRLDAWLERYPQQVRVDGGAVRIEGGPCTLEELLRVAAEVVLQGRWRRLRACPDCRWVFYDQSRNNSRTWCSMYAGQDGRACGSIAKVTRMRARQAAAPDGP